MFGLTVILIPLPMNVPPHELLYHFQDAPLPRLPPVNVNVVLLPWQIVVVPLIAVAAFDESRTINANDLQVVILQDPSARK